MAKVIIQIEDNGDEIELQMAIDPPLSEDKTIFSTAEIFGLFFREHAGDLLTQAVKWSKEANS